MRVSETVAYREFFAKTRRISQQPQLVSIWRLIMLILRQISVFKAVLLVFLSFSAWAVDVTFPDDGWYQLQDKVTYAEVCNSDASCDVPAGVYKLINHSTGVSDSNYIVESVVNSTGIEFTRNSVVCNNSATSFCSDACPANTNLLIATCDAFDWETGTTKVEHRLSMANGRAECRVAEPNARFSMMLICVNTTIKELSSIEVILDSGD